MTKNKVLGGILIIFIILFVLVTTVYAQPPLPSSFYGDIHISDGAPGVGAVVDAYVPGVAGIAASTTVKLDGGNLVYNINIPGDIPDTTPDKEGGIEGDLVTFKIGTRIVATGIWAGGTNVHLNFHPPEAIPGTPSGVVGTAVNFSGSANDAGGDVSTYKWDLDNDGLYDDATGQTPSKTWSAVGTYPVGLKVTDAQGGEGTASVDVVIGKGTATVTLGGLAQTYDGAAKSATAVTDPLGLTVNFTYNGSATKPIDANSYAVVATVDDPNYEGTASDTLVIARAGSITTVLGGGSFVYDGSSHPASVSVTGAGGLNQTPSPVYSGACSVAPVNVVDTPCTASYTFTGDANHESSTGSTTITITPLAATIVLSDLNPTYDGTPKSATVTTTPNGLANYVTYDLLPTAPTNAGSYAVAAAITDSNYSGSTSGTLIIAKAAATVTLADLAPTYDDTPKSASATTDPLGLTVDFTYDGSEIAPTAAGSYAVVATVNDTNYQGTSGGTLEIAKADSTTTVSGGGTFVYNGAARSATVSVTGVGGLNLTPAPDYSGTCAAAPVNVLDTPCTAGYAYAGDANHEGSSDSKTITITPKATTVVLSDLSHVFDGSPKSVTVTTDPAGLAHTVTYNGSSTAPSAAGSYTVVATITDPNYSGSSSDTMVISANHSIALVPGWNLVSFSLHPASTLVDDVLASVAGHYDLVYAWDASGASSGSGNWLRADNNPAPTDTLLNLDETMGFWIHMTEADTLEVVGTVPVTSNIPLAIAAGGWNLVGYPSSGSGLLPGTLSDHSTMVYAYHAGDTGDPWKLHDRGGPGYANDLTSLTAGWGYWVYVSADDTWTIGY